MCPPGRVSLGVLMSGYVLSRHNALFFKASHWPWYDMIRSKASHWPPLYPSLTPTPPTLLKKMGINANIRSSQKSQCLPYVGLIFLPCQISRKSKFFFTELVPRTLQSISCNVWDMLCHQAIFFSIVLTFTFTKVLGQIKNLKNICYIKFMKWHWSQSFNCWLRNGLKLPQDNKI